MATAGGYQTRAREALLSYLKEEPGKHYTALEIREHFKDNEKPIGTATIYRQLERFVDEGTVRKYVVDSSSSACYAYVGQSDECSSHFHCKCDVCGRLIHLDCDELQEIQKHLLNHHLFEWNPGKTVFYGTCDRCRKAG